MKNKKLVIFLFIITMILSVNHAKGAYIMLQDKPFLTVHLNTSSCTHEARINDVPLLPKSGRSVGSDVATIPVNHWVRSGENELSVKIFPMPKEESISNAKIEIAFQVKPFGDKDPDKKFTIATLCYQGSPEDEEEKKALKSSSSGTFDSNNKLKKDENGNVSVGEIAIIKIKEGNIEGVKISRKITLPLPFPEWKWFSSDLIKDNEETKLELFDVFYTMYRQIKNKDFDSIYKMFDEYKEEYVAAMYKPSLKNDPTYIADDANNPEYELMEMKPEYHKYVKLFRFGNSKLAKIVIEHNFGTAIGFNEKREGGGSIKHNFVFRKDGDNWILCR
ncbi:MAG: hypothetical protein PVI26_10325 [Chitinispirillia bacterium]|jgi:hypothetical protein